MAKYEYDVDYRKLYPEASDDVVRFLHHDDQKRKYKDYDLKAETFVADQEKCVAVFIPSREDSLERLLDEDKQFKQDCKPLEDEVIQSVMIAKMMECVALLTEAERKLIAELFFNGKSEREWSAECKIPRMTICDRKNRILEKLKKLMDLQK